MHHVAFRGRGTIKQEKATDSVPGDWIARGPLLEDRTIDTLEDEERDNRRPLWNDGEEYSG